MKYVKKDDVVKTVSDSLEGTYVLAGWQPITKNEFERVNPVEKPEKKYGRDTPTADR